MIEKRLVQWYAADAGVDLDIAERDVVLTYVLRILSEEGLLAHLAFKGGTAIRRIHLGRTGRFSLDLDFAAVGEVEPETLILELVASLHEQTCHGITFTIASPNYYATEHSCGAEATYRHEWVPAGHFGLRVSFRDQPLLPVELMPLLRERYQEWMEVDPPQVPALDLHEVIGEKVRAAAQRTRVRDLYDLHLLAEQPYDRGKVRRIAVIKCWETRFAFDPSKFLAGLASRRYDWSDLSRLVRRDQLPTPDKMVEDVRRSYAFLSDLTGEEARLAGDRYGREIELHNRLADSLRFVEGE